MIIEIIMCSHEFQIWMPNENISSILFKIYDIFVPNFLHANTNVCMYMYMKNMHEFFAKRYWIILNIWSYNLEFSFNMISSISIHTDVCHVNISPCVLLYEVVEEYLICFQFL